MKVSTLHLSPYDDEEFVSTVQRIFDIFKSKQDAILFKMDKISKHEKIKLRRLISQNPTDLIILCTFNPKVLAFSTGARIFHAINLLDWQHSLQGLKYKLKLMNSSDSEEAFPVYYNGQTISFIHSDICCIKGSGNYCHFYVHDKKDHLVTIRIKEVREKLQASDIFLDVNRSLIVNINRVASVGKDFITFRSQPKYKLKLGYRSVKKVKDELIWNN